VDNELGNINIRSTARNSIHAGLGARHQQQAAGQELRRGQDHGDLQRHVGTGGVETGGKSRLVYQNAFSGLQNPIKYLLNII
jgi:hypothetical protein